MIPITRLAGSPSTRTAPSSSASSSRSERRTTAGVAAGSRWPAPAPRTPLKFVAPGLRYPGGHEGRERWLVVAVGHGGGGLRGCGVAARAGGGRARPAARTRRGLARRGGRGGRHGVRERRLARGAGAEHVVGIRRARRGRMWRRWV